MSMLHNITVGNPKMLIKPVVYTTLANLVGILPFILLVEVARLIFQPFTSSGVERDFARLWWVCAGLGVSMVFLYLCELPAYRAQFRGAYNAAVDGRTRLAEHVRKLSLGFLNKRDPGDLASICEPR